MAINLFDKNISLLEKAMDLRSQRNTVLASNIANRETPGYKAKDVMFEKELYKAYHSNQPGNLKTTDPRHFDGVERVPLNTVSGQTINSFNPDPKMDGNTVNLDKEMAKLGENQVMYYALTQMLGRKFSGLKNIITQGGR